MLLADDTPLNLLILKSMIEQEYDVNVKVAYDGQEAIDTVFEQDKNGLKFDIILMDC